MEILIQRQYKDIKKERILDISDIDIIPLGTDEIFVELMDYKQAWLSNYGRVIRCSHGKYTLLKGNYDSNGALRYTLQKNVFFDGKWIYKKEILWAAKAVVEEFIVKVMNDIRYQPENWSKQCLMPVMCGIGYRGVLYENGQIESYLRWHDMMNRCYNERFHEKHPQYKDCKVCAEWLNYSNFKVWYDQNKIPGMKLDLDKDILFKGNKEYSPATVAFVSHEINTLFLNGKKNRGELPIGVHYDKEKKKYRAEMSFMGQAIKLGRFDTIESAYARYKEYKEDFIKDIAQQYKDEIPCKVYEAMMNWVIEITD